MVISPSSFVDNPYAITSYLSPVEDMEQCRPNDTLESAFANLSSTHEPVIVFDYGRFAGLIALQKLLFKNRLPPQARAGNALIQTPRLTVNSSLFDIVEAMLTTRLYMLPIFDSDSIPIGIIQANGLLKALSLSKENVSLLSEALEIQPATTAPLHSRVNAIYQLMKQAGVSRVVLLNKQAHVAGIVTCNDLRQVMHTFDPTTEPVRDKQPVSRVMKKAVYQIDASRSSAELIRTFIEIPFNSLVLTAHRQPVGIISTRTLLKALLRYKPVP